MSNTFPNERLRWMDDLLSELETLSKRYSLNELEGQLNKARSTLHDEAVRVNETPDHPIHNVRGPRDN